MTVTAQATFAATFVDELVRAGVADAVVAPGSRSTPLALALAADPRVRVSVVLDERSAGFFALGLGLATGVPAAVVTTSGTAAAELHAAVVEAHQAGVPLLACTADRPPELHHVGAPQTIEQAGLYPGATRWAADLGAVDALPVAAWRSVAARAVAECRCGPGGPGPVHLNLGFRDPLVGEAGDVPPGRPGGRPWHDVLAAETTVEIPPEWVSGRRGLVVAGWGCDAEAVADWAERLGWPVLADPRSGLRGHPHAVAAFDPLLRMPAFPASSVPEVVLRVGGPPASKVLGQWLGPAGAGGGALHLVVDPHGRWPDPDRTTGVVLRAVPLVDAEPAPGGWLEGWLHAEATAQAAIDDTLAGRPDLVEPGVARALSAALPAGARLVASSSMPVRDLEWFGAPGDALPVLANRGANGIDGVVSTALGVAASGAPTVALLGDLAFLHDAGGLLWCDRRGTDCTFVVVDNDGGAIFSFLPQAQALDAAVFETLFGTPHGVDLAALAAVHRIPVARVDTAADAVDAVHESLRAGGVRLVHVASDRAANVAAHDVLNAAVAAAVGALRG